MNRIEQMKDNWRYVFAVGFLSAADFSLTRELIEANGLEAEANPLMYWLMAKTGAVWSMLIFKFAGVAALWTLSFFAALPERLMHVVIWTYMAVVTYSVYLVYLIR